MLEMEKPRIECVEKDASTNYGKFVIEPLERGYGTTLGNSCVGFCYPRFRERSVICQDRWSTTRVFYHSQHS